MTAAGALRRLAVLLAPPILPILYRRLFPRTPAAAAPEPPSAPVATPPLALAAAPEQETAAAPAALPEPPEWEIVPDTDETWASLPGWDHRSVADLQVAKWPGFLKSVEGPWMLGRSHEGSGGPPDVVTHNTLACFGYALARACAGRAEASLLDWGGGVGHYAHYARALLPGVAFDYHVKDLPGLCAAGRRLQPDLTFHEDDAAALARAYDVVLASSSIHYVRDPHAMLARLCASARDWVFVTRTPFVEDRDDMLVVQRPHRYGYMTEYAGWFLNLPRFLETAAAAGFALERQFLIGEKPFLPDFDGTVDYQGLLLRRKAS